jgi:hypothetical protein
MVFRLNTHSSNPVRIIMKQINHLVFLALLISVVGCAGTVKPPHIYSPEETGKQGLGGVTAKEGATGEISYCDAGMAFQVKSRKEQAYAAIAKACGGEDKYYVTGDLDSGGQARTVVGGMETSCTGLAGRLIIFKCTGTLKPKPSGLRSDQ